MNITPLLTQLIKGKNLTYDEMQQAMQAIMTGATNDIENAAFLVAISAKGETEEEIRASAEVMRELATRVPVGDPDELVDPVGTGGTYSNIFNVSTASAIVANCAGVKIAKHGSRSASSKSGSADLLEAAGINIDLNPEQIKACIEKFGIGFMYAPALHSAMKNVMSARKVMGIRTIFNLLGPLTNPSGAKRQVLGCFSKHWLEPLATACQKLGQRRVMVVNSQDDLDEISIAAVTDVCELKDDSLRQYQIDPRQYGIYHDNINALRVQSPEVSLALIKAAFAGNSGAAFDMITLNSAAIIAVSPVESDYDEAIAISRRILQSGEAQAKLEQYAQFTQRLAKMGALLEDSR